ncbi:hypothetical protein [Plantactinospora sp. BB1]|uniref:hypothetical protein n=1 Tax=Plantactinospora sp. BB1 TaxID=2071627 RepID=UPI00131F17D7|nr:hypothetical protein [Plantactinospora sp. BB1]
MAAASADPVRGVAAGRTRRALVRVALPLVLVTIGVLIGLTAAKLADDPHTARSEMVTGTVTWSNDRTRLFVLERDGAVPDPLHGDTVYTVIADGWQDAGGTLHGEGSYPSCLAGAADDPVSTDRHRVELEVLHRDVGAEPQHIAVHVRCLD